MGGSTTLAAVIRDDWPSWLEGGPALHLATAGRDGTAHCVRASGLYIVATDLVRLTFNREAGRHVAEDLAAGSWASVSASNIFEYKCLQFKGRAELVEPTPRDLEASATYREAFVTNLAHKWAGLDAKGCLNMRLVPECCAALRIHEIYDQSRGRGAGRRVAPP
jgi:hypothetical protein